MSFQQLGFASEEVISCLPQGLYIHHVSNRSISYCVVSGERRASQLIISKRSPALPGMPSIVVKTCVPIYLITFHSQSHLLLENQKLLLNLAQTGPLDQLWGGPRLVTRGPSNGAHLVRGLRLPHGSPNCAKIGAKETYVLQVFPQ